MRQTPFTSKQWRRVEYERLVDRGVFEDQHARAGIADYWIVNLVDHVVQVYRDPVPDLTAPFGWRYSSVERFRPPATLTLLELPQATVPVAALLP